MAHDFTKVANLVVHDEFAGYFAQAMVDRSTMLKSGIAAIDPAVAEIMNTTSTKGDFVKLPFFKELTKGEAEIIKDDGTELTVDKITAGEDIAVIMRRGKAFGSTDLSAMLAGADPMAAIAAGLADWWNAEKQARLFKVLDGILTTGGALASHVKDITGASAAADKLVTVDALLDAGNTLGDRKSDIIAYAMNANTENHLAKLNSSYMVRPSDKTANLVTFNGKTVVIDDNIPDGVVYLFGAGAVAMNDGKVEKPFEPFRQELASQGGIITRHAGIVHVRGVKWATTVTNPNNAALGTKTNYTLAYPHKMVRVAKLVGTIA